MPGHGASALAIWPDRHLRVGLVIGSCLRTPSPATLARSTG